MGRSQGGKSSDVVLTELRQDILDGRYQPRERLVESELSAQYGATRSATRTALIELTNEGLVEREPNRGARVRLVSVDEAIEIAEVRLTLQGVCAARAAERGSPEDKEELTQLLESLREAVDSGDIDSLHDANLRISARIRQMAEHHTANRIIEQLLTQHVHRWFPLALPERRVESFHENERIVDAIVAGDVDGAKTATQEHLERLLNALYEARDRSDRPAELGISV